MNATDCRDSGAEWIAEWVAAELDATDRAALPDGRAGPADE